jgi:G6PDH family F420-dependent oxidoreductase
MTQIGYTMMCEQAGPKQLVRDVQLAEDVGFDFAVISDHYFPWLDEQGHAPYAWSVLGAAAQATRHIPLMTYVTCPIRRYHPAVVAQKAATMQLLSDGRFTLGLGAGENLNEHIVGGQWPIVGVRHEMLEEAVEIIRALWSGDMVPTAASTSTWSPRGSGTCRTRLHRSASPFPAREAAASRVGSPM